MYRQKRSGLSGHPCLTPMVLTNSVVTLSPTYTLCVVLVEHLCQSDQIWWDTNCRRVFQSFISRYCIECLLEVNKTTMEDSPLGLHELDNCS